MNWRIETERKVGAKPKRVAVLTVDADELEVIATGLATDEFHDHEIAGRLLVDLGAAQVGLARRPGVSR